MEVEALVEVNSITINHVQSVQVPGNTKSYEQLFLEKTGKDFNTFYKKYYNKLVWIIQRMNINTIDAEGLTNDAFMQALNKIDKYNPQYHFSTWLFDIGKKMAYQYKNDQKKREILVDTTSDDSEDNDPIQYYLKNKMDSVYVESDSQKLIACKYDETLREISKLDPKYKRIIELSDIQGKSYNQIIEILGTELSHVQDKNGKIHIKTPEQCLGTVKNRLHHGRLRLENNLKEKFKLIEKNF